jgi:hypothetical protein
MAFDLIDEYSRYRKQSACQKASGQGSRRLDVFMAAARRTLMSFTRWRRTLLLM